MKRLLAAIALAVTLSAADSRAAQPPPAQEGFVPVADAATERLPAARFVMTAYGVAWVVIFVYLWSIWRRLDRVERELAEVARRGREQGRS
jgi:CcmD family protein